MNTQTKAGWMGRIFSSINETIEDWSVGLTLLVTAGVFFGCWAYAIATYGWFLGGALGGIPSAMFAFAALWVVSAMAIELVQILIVILVLFIAAVIWAY